MHFWFPKERYRAVLTNDFLDALSRVDGFTMVALAPFKALGKVDCALLLLAQLVERDHAALCDHWLDLAA